MRGTPPPLRRSSRSPPPPPRRAVSSQDAFDASSVEIDVGFDRLLAEASTKTRALPPRRGVAGGAMLPVHVVAFHATGYEVGQDEVTQSLTLRVLEADTDVTAPLPAVAPRSELYEWDTDPTRPLVPRAHAAALPPPPPFVVERAPVYRMLALPPPPVLPRSAVPVVVSVPRRSAGVVEQSPSIQIRQTAAAAAVPAGLEPRASSTPGVPVVVDDSSPRTIEHDTRRWLVTLAAIAFGAAVVGVGMRPQDGSVVVTVSGPSGGAVRGVTVRVDGAERCASAPCEVKGLMPGVHLVSAAATGLSQSAIRAFVIGSGESAAQHIALSKVERSSAGLNVTAIGAGLRVFVDDRDVGAPPISLDAVEPGDHTVRVAGTDRYYQPYEASVHLGRGEVRSLGPVRLRVIRGRLQLIAGDGSEGARVAVDGRPVLQLPAVLELSASESHEVTATRPGFDDFSSDVVFDRGAEQSVQVRLERPGDSAAAPIAVNVLPPARSRGPRPPGAHPATGRVQQSAPIGAATLDLSSIPRAAVVLNGRPIGTTPLRGIGVGPGTQTIVFVHPQLGRKVASATVAPGGRAAVSVKF